MLFVFDLLKPSPAAAQARADVNPVEYGQMDCVVVDHLPC